jgi:hypothetical protein
MPITEFQEEQEWVLKVKPFLRFRPGDIVFFKTDRSRSNPMVIKCLCNGNDDYVAHWFNSQKTMEVSFFSDCSLVPDDRG